MMAHMKIIFALVVLLFAFPAFAGGKCVLKNKEFCGTWGDKRASLEITGDHLQWDEYFYADCSSQIETRIEGKPHTLLKCITTPDPRYAVNSKPYLSFYLLVMYPKEKLESTDTLRMFFYSGDFDKQDVCFSGNIVERERCNLQDFDKQHRHMFQGSAPYSLLH